MKVLNTRRITEKFMQIMEIKRASSMVNMIIANSIAANTIVPPDPDGLREEAMVIQKEMPEYSVDRVMLLLMVEAMLGSYLEQQPGVIDFFMNWIAEESKVFDAEKMENPPMDESIYTVLEKRKENYIHRLLSDVEITKPEHIDYYMKPKNIITLIDRTDIIFEDC